MEMVLIAAVAFVGTHFLLSHPLRRPIVARLGERGFAGVYVLVAFATLGWVILAYRAAPMTAPLWAVGDGLWALVTAVMLIASVLLMGSLIGNPALPGPPGELPTEAKGVFAVTRHPMMWSFALWGLCHIAVFPVAANMVVAGAVALLALLGARLQDIKKQQLQPDRCAIWQAKTSYWPFAASAAGRALFGCFRPHDIAGGVVTWRAATWAHLPLAGIAAGVWRWF